MPAYGEPCAQCLHSVSSQKTCGMNLKVRALELGRILGVTYSDFCFNKGKTGAQGCLAQIHRVHDGNKSRSQVLLRKILLCDRVIMLK